MISKEVKFLLTHSSIYGIGTIVSRLVAFILLPLYTRYLTPIDYGVLETIDISSGLIGLVITVGISRALSRFYYEADHTIGRYRVVSTTYILYFIISLTAIPFLLTISNPISSLLFENNHYGYYFNISFASLILGGFVDIGMMYLRILKRSTIFISITIIRLLLLIMFNVLFIVYYQLGILGILYSSLIVRTIFAVLITTSILFKTKLSFSGSIIRNLLSYSLPMIPSNLANMAVKQSDKYFVLLFLSLSDMGIYSLSLKIGNAIHSLVTTSFNLAYIPRRFELMNNPDASKIYSLIFTYYIFVVVFIGLALSLLIPEILQFMVTKDFRRAGDIIPLVVLSMIIFGTHFHFDFGILYSKNTKYLAYINISCAVIQIISNILLIRMFGLYGAVFSSIIVFGIQAALLYITSQRLYPIQFEFKRVFAYLVVAGIIFFLSRIVQTPIFWLNIVIKNLLLFGFVFVIHVLKILSAGETGKLKALINKQILSKFRKVSLINTT